MKRLLIHLPAAVAGGLLLVAVLRGSLPHGRPREGHDRVFRRRSIATGVGTFVDHMMLGQLRPWMFLAEFVSTLAARLSPTPLGGGGSV